MFLDNIEREVPVELCPFFHIPPTPPVKRFKDAVIDPRESWSAFWTRIAKFEDPPLVERSELPPELQPQNRVFGKLRILFNKDTINTAVESQSLDDMSFLNKNNNSKLTIASDSPKGQTNNELRSSKIIEITANKI